MLTLRVLPHLCLVWVTGLPESGLPETIAQSIALLPEDLQGMFWSNVGVFGGSTLFPGFKERLYVPRLLSDFQASC